MDANKSLRIILGGVLLLLAAGSLRWRMAKPETPAETPAFNEPAMVMLQRPGKRFQPAVRAASPRVASPRTPNQPALPTQNLLVEWKGTWYAAELLASANGSHYIHYSGYGPEWDEWVTPDRMRFADAESAPPENPAPQKDSSPAQTVRMTPEPGEPVVLYGGQWWRAEVLKTEGDKSLIRYVGYGAEWDEWVGPDRFKVYSEEDARTSAATVTLTFPVIESPTVSDSVTVSEPQLDFAPLVQGRPAQGDLLVEWGKKWWPAEILKQDGASYLIHYKGYDNSWDEWVSLERIGHYTGAE
jgi:hypothetical protein